MIENLVPAGWEGPLLHYHDFDETFYVLEGELTFQLGDDLFTRKRGSWRSPPRRPPHPGQPGRRGGRYVLVCTPAGFERRFDLMAAEQAGVEPPPVLQCRLREAPMATSISSLHLYLSVDIAPRSLALPSKKS